MKKWLIAVLFVIPIAASAYNSTGTSFPLIVVNNGAGTQSDPHVSSTYATYTDTPFNGTNTIRYFNFAAAASGSVPLANDTVDSLSDISGGNIVFTRVDVITGASAIYEYSIGSGSASEVAPTSSPQRRNPAIGGSTIVWEDTGVSASSDPELVLTTGGGTIQLTNDPAADQNPNVSADGNAIAWEKCSSPGSCDVYVARNSGGIWTTTAVAASSANERSADTNGTHVVYVSDAGGVNHVYVAAIGGVASQIPATTLAENHPAIAGTFVAFEGTSGTQTDIFVYDFATGTLHQITNTPETETLSDIAFDGTTVRVVWQVKEVDLNIYATEFSVAPTPEDQLNNLIATVGGLGLPYGTANSLTVKLQNAAADLAAGNTTDACNELNAFINEVQAQSGKKLTTQEADQLIASAQAIQAALGCP